MIKQGNALELLQELEESSIATAYFDPPFNTGRDFALDSTEEGKKVKFSDKWDSDEAYQQFIDPVVSELARVLKPDGSLFFHISAAEMFIPELVCRRHFKNVKPIFWKKSRSKNNVKKKLGATIDVIFQCSAAKEPKFNPVYQPLDAYYLENSYKNKDDRGYYALGHLVNGRTRTIDPVDDQAKPADKQRLYSYEHTDGRTWNPPNGWRLSKEALLDLVGENRVHFPAGKGNLYRKIYKHESKGKPATDLWDDIHSIAQGSERFYPTQKPDKLLERIVEMSSDPGDTVLDPMAGSGTTPAAARRLGRKYVAFDLSEEAVRIMKEKREL